MAKGLVPNIPNLKRESAYVINGSSLAYPGQDKGLFDGIRGVWNNASTGYFGGSSGYIDITLENKTNVWVLPNAEYPSYNSGFNISVWNGSNFIPYVKTADRTKEASKWEMMCTLPRGRYKFNPIRNYRMDDEWYLENASENKTLIYHEGQYKKWNPGIHEPARNIIPVMTSNTSPSGIAEASSVYGESWGPWTIMDGKLYSQGGYWHASARSGWVSYELTEEVDVVSYSIKTINGYPERMPSEWYLETYNYENNSWEKVHHVVLSAATQEKLTYSLEGSVRAKKFRLNMLDNFTRSTSLSLDLFELNADPVNIPAHWSIATNPEEEGMDAGSIPKEAIDLLEGNFEVVSWVHEGTFDREINISGTRKNLESIQVPNKDISLIGVESFSLFLVASGSGKISPSVDSGNQWLGLVNDEWVPVKDASEGLTFEEFNNLTEAQRASMKNGSNAIRFSYYLTGDTEIDKLTMQVDMQGREVLADSSIYKVSYDQANKTIIYDINKNGTYTINYVDGN